MSANTLTMVAERISRLALRTPTLPPATHTNSYLLGTKQALLVEPASPYPDEIARAVASIQAARARGMEILAIVATHHHVDHIGGAVALSRELKLPLWAHPATIARLAGLVAFDRPIHDGQLITLRGDTPMHIRVVHTPGHAPGHVCLLDEDSGAMIAGDMVAGIGTILVEPQDGDMSLYIASLERMRSLSPSVLLPAHGNPIHDAESRLTQYIQHRLMREEKIFAALEALGSVTDLTDLLPAAYDDAPQSVWPIAALSVEAHLLKLVKDGRVQKSHAGWRVS